MKMLFQYGALRGLGKVLALVCLMSGAARADQVQIAILGDSLSQGYGLIEQEGLVPQLRAWLADQGADVRVVNAGVSGDTTAGGLARVDWTLTSEIQGLVVILGGNDLLRGIDPAVSRANLDGILNVADDKGVPVLVVGMSAPGNYGADYKTAFDAMYPELAEAHGAAYAGRFFDGYPSDDPAKVQNLMQMDGIHPNAKGVALVVEELGPDVLALVRHIAGE